jgi:hypothetical protein
MAGVESIPARKRRRNVSRLRLLRAYARWRPEVWGVTLVWKRFYAGTGSSTMSRVREGSTLIPGPIVVAKVTERM